MMMMARVGLNKSALNTIIMGASWTVYSALLMLLIIGRLWHMQLIGPTSENRNEPTLNTAKGNTGGKFELSTHAYK